jgi:hypothetical protein
MKQRVPLRFKTEVPIRVKTGRTRFEAMVNFNNQPFRIGDDQQEATTKVVQTSSKRDRYNRIALGVWLLCIVTKTPAC